MQEKANTVEMNSSVNPLGASARQDERDEAYKLMISRTLNHQHLEVSSKSSTLGATVTYHLDR
jgi:hypothetical protein